MRHRNIESAIVMALLLTVASAGAFGSGDDRGTSGFKGLQMLSAMETRALGGAVVSMPEPMIAFDANPAAAAFATKRTARLSMTSYIADIMPARGVVFLPSGKNVWSVAVSALSYGDFDRVSETAVDAGTFSASDFVMHVGWARTFAWGLSGGVSIGYIRSEIADWTASAAVFNLGATWRSPDGHTSVGVSAMNLGSALSAYDGDDDGIKDTVPTTLHFGAMHRPEHFPLPLTIMAGIQAPRDDDMDLSVGAELCPVDMLVLRVGYRSLVRYRSITNDDGEKETKLTLDDRDSGGFGDFGFNGGVGIRWRSYSMDYSWSLAGPFGSIHGVSIGMGW
jgi:hypothetical protein